MVACETAIRGACAKARSKITLWPARSSSLGLIFVCAPRKPMRSARVDSKVINTMLGLPAARAQTGEKLSRTSAPSRNPENFSRAHRNMNSVYLSAYSVSSVVQWIGYTNNDGCAVLHCGRLLLETRTRKLCLTLTLCAAATLLCACQRPAKWLGDQKLIILGIDGMDPQLLKRFMAEGQTPNFSPHAPKASVRMTTPN